jgi:hypothetical protein
MIGLIIIPYSFTNNIEVADAVKVNSNFSTMAAAINEVITSIEGTAGTQATLTARLAISLNDDGTLKPYAFPIGTFDTRVKRTVSANTDITNNDSLILVDTSAGDVTVTLPPTIDAFAQPTIVNIGKTGYAVIVTPDGTDLVLGGTEYQLTQAGEFVQFAREGSDWWRIK